MASPFRLTGRGESVVIRGRFCERPLVATLGSVHRGCPVKTTIWSVTPTT